MGIIQIRRAQRANARLVIGLASVSGDGKTYTALQLGYGLANYDASKLGMLDTENRRGSLYDDCLEQSTRPTKERFWIGDLQPPFTPQRYIDAIKEFEAAGVEVLIIDSVTHEWEGIGGCVEIAEAGNPKVPNWNRAKNEHKRFVNTMLQCDMHIIVCVRAREKVKLEKNTGNNNKLEFVDLGLQPVQEKNFMFEMTSSLMLYEQGKRQSILKVPANLINILGRREGYLTSDDGKALRDWNDGAIKLDPTVERFRNRLLSNTEVGVAHIESCWAKTPEAVREALGEAFHGTLVESAKSYDALKKEAEDAQRAEGGEPSTQSDRVDGEDAAAASSITARALTNSATQGTGSPKREEAPTTVNTQSAADRAPKDAPPPKREEPKQQELPTAPAERKPAPATTASKATLAPDPVF